MFRRSSPAPASPAGRSHPHQPLTSLNSAPFAPGPTPPPKARTQPAKQSSLLTSPATDDGSRMSWVGSEAEAWQEARSTPPTSANSSGNITPRSRSNSTNSAGKGIGGLLKKLSGVRRRKSSASVKGASEVVCDAAPPVPAMPDFARLSLGLGMLPPVLTKDGEADSGYGASLVAGRDPSVERGPAANSGVLTAKEATADLVSKLNTAATGGEDLTSLLYLVHAAGNKFADEDHSAQETPTHTPKLDGGSFEFSSPASVSTAATVPSPKPLYSFLSHVPQPTLSPSRPPAARSPSAPPSSRPTKPAKVESDSEDDYGGESDEDVWVKRPNSAFARKEPVRAVSVPAVASIPKAPVAGPVRPAKAATRGLGLPPPTPPRGRSPGRRTLGPRAKQLLEITAARLKPTTSSADNLNRPLSTNSHQIVSALPGSHSLRIVVGRTTIGRKLRQGTTMMEAIEIEHEASSRRSSNMSGDSTTDGGVVVPEGVDASLDRALKLLADDDQGGVDTFNATHAPAGPMPWRTAAGFNSIQSPAASSMGMSELPTRSGIAAWVARPTFVESHMIHLAVAGGTTTDLVKPRLAHPALMATSSPRLRALTALSTDRSPLPSPSLPDEAHRPARSRKPESGLPRARADTATSPPAFVAGVRAPVVAVSLPVPAARAGKKSVGPGPLLMKALEEGELEAVVDDGAHGASANPPPTGSSAVRRAQEKAYELKVELAWLKQQEVERKAALAEQVAVQKARSQAEAYAREVARLRQTQAEEVERHWKAQQKEVERARERELEFHEAERQREIERRLEEQRRRSRAAGQVPEGENGAKKASHRPPMLSPASGSRPSHLTSPLVTPTRSASPAYAPSPARSPADATAFQLQMQQQQQAHLAMMAQAGAGYGYGYMPVPPPMPMMMPPAGLYGAPALAGSTTSLRASVSLGGLYPPTAAVHASPPRTRTPKQSHAGLRDSRLNTIQAGGSEDGHGQGRMSPAKGQWVPRGFSTPPGGGGQLPRSRSSHNLGSGAGAVAAPKETSAQRVQRRLSQMPPLPHSASQPVMAGLAGGRASHRSGQGRMSMQRSVSTPAGLVAQAEQGTQEGRRVGPAGAAGGRPASRVFLDGAGRRVAEIRQAEMDAGERRRGEGKGGLVRL